MQNFTWDSLQWRTIFSKNKLLKLRNMANKAQLVWSFVVKISNDRVLRRHALLNIRFQRVQRVQLVVIYRLSKRCVMRQPVFLCGCGAYWTRQLLLYIAVIFGWEASRRESVKLERLPEYLRDTVDWFMGWVPERHCS